LRLEGSTSSKLFSSLSKSVCGTTIFADWLLSFRFYDQPDRAAD